MLTGERPAHDDALHRFGHIQPRAGEWRVERQNAMSKEPIDQIVGQVSGKIIPHYNDT